MMIVQTLESIVKHIWTNTAEEDITEEIECPELSELDGYVSDASTITRDLSALCTMADQEVILVLRPTTKTQIKGGYIFRCPLRFCSFSNEDNTAVSLELHPAPIRESQKQHLMDLTPKGAFTVSLELSQKHHCGRQSALVTKAAPRVRRHCEGD
ncbi:hypothetical protein ACLKA6_010076 [Drosophila palustris]